MMKIGRCTVNGKASITKGIRLTFSLAMALSMLIVSSAFAQELVNVAEPEVITQPAEVFDAMFDIDNTNATFTPTTAGAWTTLTGGGAYGTNYAYASCSGSAAITKEAVFDSSKIGVTATTTDNYAVFVRWISDATKTTAAAYRIYAGTALAGGCVMNQQKRGGEWIYCDTVTLAEGNAGVVKIGNDCGKTTLKVVADAVRFVKIQAGPQGPAGADGPAGPGLDTGKITGTVSACGEAVTRSLVYIPGRSFSVYTADDGKFEFSYLPAGAYNIKIETSGYQAKALSNVTVMGGQTTDTGSVLVKDLNVDPYNCGACGNICAAANSWSVCAAGLCQIGGCDKGYTDCDGNPANGCEANLSTDTNNCGACNNACASGLTCVNGSCGISCDQGYSVCANSCVNTLTDVNNCGSCNAACATGAHSQTACVNGTCRLSACDANYADCDFNPTNGCETNLFTSVSNCGMCGHTCSSGQACVNGVCQ